MGCFPRFNIEHDYEFYCYLKANLPSGYEIVALPSTAYYSEWQYDYTVRKGTAVVAQFRGCFKDLKPGQLVQQARDLLEALSATNRAG